MKPLTKRNRVKIQSDKEVMVNDKPCPNIGFIGYPEHHLLEALALAKKKIGLRIKHIISLPSPDKEIATIQTQKVNELHKASEILDECFPIGQDAKGSKKASSKKNSVSNTSETSQVPVRHCFLREVEGIVEREIEEIVREVNSVKQFCCNCQNIHNHKIVGLFGDGLKKLECLNCCSINVEENK